MNKIIIRDLTKYDELLQVQKVQQACWGFSGGEGLYPPVLLTASQNGGTVLGAFDDDKLVGFLFGFVGIHANRGPLKICSQTMGVLAEYRAQGIAEELKWAQRDRALKLGINLITWTYDPLEGASARLNLHKLNGFVRTYKRNIYGEHFGAINDKVPTDRFMVEWRIDEIKEIKSNYLKAIGFCETKIITHVMGDETYRKLTKYDLASNNSLIYVDIPLDTQAMRRENLDLILDWRMKTREIFEAYFSRGYIAVDFIQRIEDNQKRNTYILWYPSEEWLNNVRI